MIPSALVSAALALAAFRTYHLTGRDTFPPIAKARNWLVGRRVKERNRAVWFDRPLLAEFLTCAWCSGFWIALGWYGAWLLWPSGVLYAAVPAALSAAVGILAALVPE